MTDRAREAERALHEGIRGGSMHVDPGHEGIPEAFDRPARVKPPSAGAKGLSSATGHGLPITTRTPDTSGGLLETTSSSTAPTLPRDHHGGMNPLKAFTSQGSVGKQFNPEGSLGSIPQAVGGPFDKEGVIGKQFTSEGYIGGTVDKVLGDKNKDDPLM